MDIRDLLADERRGLADVLEGLTPEQWDTPTLSAGWTVRHVAAHLVMPFRYSVPQIAFRLLKARGDFNRMADRVARHDASLPTEELVATLRANAMHPFTPPGAGFEAPLTDLVVHSLDIARPLSIELPRSTETARLVLDNVTTAHSLKFFGIDLAGIELRAADTDWSFGTGAPVAGSAEDLILALCGREAGAEKLTGAGSGVLTGQMQSSR